MIHPNFVTKQIESKDNFARFELTPLPSGFGHSMGNAFRRVLLSTIEGSAVTYVTINDVVHAFSTIEGIKESTLNLLLNLKELNFKTTGKGPFKLELHAKGKGVVTAKDFKGGDIEVVNTDQHIAELTTASAKLDIEMTVERGYGFEAADDKEDKKFGSLAVDSIFSPVRKVVYSVSPERVGRMSNFDKLTLDIWTDGSITPEEALMDSAHSLGNFFSYILSGEDTEEVQKKKAVASTVEETHDDKVNEIIIDELDLPTRVINALLRENIETVGDLIEKGEETLVNLKGVGRKSITLIEKELEKFGIKLDLK